MRKPGRGALYYCSSEQGTPRGVERTTWLSRGFTGAISTPFFAFKNEKRPISAKRDKQKKDQELRLILVTALLSPVKGQL